MTQPSSTSQTPLSPESGAQSAGYRDRFGGLGRLFGEDALPRLARARVAVVGIGGVGSWAAEALARSGVGGITLIDLDDVCVTNVNRQLHALDGEIGRSKVAATLDRLRRIHPDGDLQGHECFLTERNAAELLPPDRFDGVIDAIDAVTHKASLVDHCLRHHLPVITTGAAGGKSDATAVRIDDLARATNDRLLKRLRKRLRQEYGYPEAPHGAFGEPFGATAIFSIENARYPWSDGTVCDTAEPGGPLKLDCESGFGTASFVTGSFGFAAAGELVKRLTGG